MTSRLRFTRRAAAALFLQRQHLERPRAKRLTAANLTRFAEDTGGIQLDSINVLDRAHHLTVWSRFGPYDRARLARMVYRDRLLIEYWAHAACLVPRAHIEWWRRAMRDYQFKHTGWAKWLRTNRKVVAAVEGALRDKGPLGNADFKHARPPGTSGWWSWKPAAFALHYLWMTGRVAVDDRVHFQKRFDLAERVLGPDPPEASIPSAEAFRRWHMRRSLHAMGAATETDVRMYLTFPRGPASDRKNALRAMLASGEIVTVEIEGERAPWLVLAEDLPALAAAGRARAPSRGTTLLAPFDSLIWYRERAQRLFGFDYRIEVYTPGHKRVHGYYSLPILHDGQLVGRLDAKNHRQKRELEVRSVHLEPWVATGGTPPAASWGRVDVDTAVAGIAEALGSLATFAGATRVRLGPGVRKASRTALNAALSALEVPAEPASAEAQDEALGAPRSRTRRVAVVTED